MQLEPAEKRTVARKAKALGMSVNDYVRKAIRSFQPQEIQEGQVDVVLRQAVASAARAEKALDRALAAIAASERRLKRLEHGGGKALPPYDGR